MVLGMTKITQSLTALMFITWSAFLDKTLLSCDIDFISQGQFISKTSKRLFVYSKKIKNKNNLLLWYVKCRLYICTHLECFLLILTCDWIENRRLVERRLNRSSWRCWSSLNIHERKQLPYWACFKEPNWMADSFIFWERFDKPNSLHRENAICVEAAVELHR